MNIRDISKPVTAKALNESLARKFGQKIKLENFTIEQLEDARNKIRTKLSQVEMNENFDAVIKNESYQKSKLFLDVLNAAIAERSMANVTSAASAPASDNTTSISSAPASDNTTSIGQRTTPLTRAERIKSSPEYVKAQKSYMDALGRRDRVAAELIKMAIKQKFGVGLDESIVREGAEDEAELVMAAKDMVDRVTGWMEDTAEMQTESMLELADAIRDEMGSEKSEAFVSAVKPALESMYGVMETTRQTLTSGVGMLTGEEDPVQTMGDEPVEEPPMEPTVDGEEDIPLPDFDAAAPAAGGEAEAGREQRESKRYSKKQIAERSRKLAATLSKKK